MKHLLSFLLFLTTFSFTSAQSNHSLSFDGVDDYVEVPNDGSLSNFPSGFSVQTTIKVPNQADGDRYVFGEWGNRGIFLLYTNGSDLVFNLDGPGVSATTIDFSSYFGEWVNIAAVYDNYLPKVYINGVLVGQGTAQDGNVWHNQYNGGSLKIGMCNSNCGTGYAEMFMDYGAMWNIPLTTTDILDNYNNGISSQNSNLVAHWNFNDGEGSTLTDLSGNSNHGTINGATWSTDVPTPPDNNHSLSFDGVDDDVNIGDIDLVNNFTIISYVKPDYSLWNGDGGENDMIVGKGDSYMLGMHETWGLYAELLPTGSGTWEGSNSTYLQNNGISPTFLSENTWSQVATTYDGQDLKVYVNGVMIYQIALSIDINQNDQSTVIGNCSSPHDDRWLKGNIDETSIWNIALTQEQIQSQMNHELTGTEEGIVGYWNFNDGEGSTLTDLSGNGNHGTINGATWSDDVPPAPQQTSPNHSLSFDGQDDYVQIADSDELDGMENLTVQFWVKFNSYNDYSTGSEGYNILSKSEYGQDANIEVSYSFYTAKDEDGMTFLIQTDNGQADAHLSGYESIISLNQWHHITGTYDGNYAYLFIDGELKATSSQREGSIYENDYALRFGSTIGTSWNTYFDGLIDEVSIMSTALTSDQIQEHMDSPLSGDESGLVGYWNFNDGEGSTLTDLSGNGNHGTINGATWSDDGAPFQPLEELDTIATITLSDVNTYIFPGYIGDTALVAVTADLGDIDLYSSEMHFTGFQGVLGFEGIVTEGTPMGDADWNVVVNEQEEVLITGNYGSDAISGDVTLFYLQFSVGDSLSEDSIAIQLAHVELNEEEGEIETFDGSVSVSHLLFGDVTQNDDVSMMDAANVLRYLVGSVDFDKYQMSAADVTMDESISALDASVVAQYGVGLVESLPHSDGTDGSGDLIIDDMLQYETGEILEIPVMLTNGDNLLSFEVDLTYDPNQVTVESIEWSELIDHFMIEENNESGSIRVAGSGTTPDGEQGVFATIRLQVLETTTDQSIDLTINKMRINEAEAVEDVIVSITQEVLSTDNATVPNVYALHQNYPNPFNPTTKISYDLPEASVVSLSIYDLMGREIRTMINSEQTAGFKNIQWNATDNLGKSVPAGMYIYTIQAGEFRQTRKMVLLK
tara:strand:+ start:273 stop:3695 length:3423 start_codon:yes stop_codon:yes gene_type:complete